MFTMNLWFRLSAVLGDSGLPLDEGDNQPVPHPRRDMSNLRIAGLALLGTYICVARILGSA